MTKQTGMIGWVLCLISGALLAWGLGHASPGASSHFNNPATWDDSAAAVPVTSKDPMWGSRFAPVTIVVFSDYQCPHCKKIEETYASLKRKYGGEKLRIIWKNNPLAMHPGARPASEAGAVVMSLAGNDVFWRYHELVFGNPKAINTEQIVTWAVEAGVDKQKFLEAQATTVGVDKVKEDLEVGAKGGVRGTPAAFINGIFKSGNLPESEFVKIIDAELVATAELLKAGTPADKIYVKRSLINKPTKADVKPAPTATPDEKQGAATPPSAPTGAPGDSDKGTAEDATEAALAKKEKPADVIHKIPVEGSPARGPAEALVTIVELGDLSCPFTAAMEPVLLEAMKLYDGKLRLVWKHHPMRANPRSVPAQLLAIEAQSQKGSQEFWSVHEKLLASKSFDDAALLAIASERRLDLERVKAVLTDGNPATPGFDPPLAATAASALIARDKLLASSFEVGGSPTFFINGKRVVGVQTIEKLKLIIDGELAKAEGMVAAGTPASGVYAALMADAKQPEMFEVRTVVPPVADTPFRGAADAKVEMHTFLDFECVHCKRVQNVVALVEKRYGDRLKIVYRDDPLAMHKTAPLASQAALEALSQRGPDGFFAYHDALFELQGTEDFDKRGFERIAEKQGLDMVLFRSALSSEKHQPRVDKNVEDAKNSDIKGTPGFVFTYQKQGNMLEGYFFSGAANFAKFERAIALATEKAGAAKVN